MAKFQYTPAPLAKAILQDLFVQNAPNALAPDFIYSKNKDEDSDEYEIVMRQTIHDTGLKNSAGEKVTTKIWGYGEKGHGKKVTWPGKTFEVQSNVKTEVKWNNELKNCNGKPIDHLLPIDDSLHWCYSLPDKSRSIAKDGIPLVPHLHGGHNRPETDGNPEYFEGLSYNSRGPRFVSNEYNYDNSQRAGTLWYHDHALGITRLNVYAGLAGFYIIRDEHDTGKHNNPLGLPAKQYELAYCVQDRMFLDSGELFYPAFYGDSSWDEFFKDPKITPPNPKGPSVLAEFFGDHIVVNGKLWPKANVEPRHYRIRWLNGSDSRFMRLQLRCVAANATELTGASAPLPFTVIGSDQGLLKQSTDVTSLDFMPGERLDIVFDFSSVPANSRIIVENILGDKPFNGDVPPASDRRTDRIMAFDVNLALNFETEFNSGDDDDENSPVADQFDKQTFDNKLNGLYPELPAVADKIRKLALFEGKDDTKRLMPMLGTAEKVTDVSGVEVNGSLLWDAAITENPNVGDTEIWEIYNATGDAHPIHVHLVHFDILDRQNFNIKATDFLVQDDIITESGGTRIGFHLDLDKIEMLKPPATPVLASEKGPKDMVICYPGQITQIKMTFDRAGRYVWHCHILSHEDHEMMRPLHVGPI